MNTEKQTLSRQMETVNTLPDSHIKDLQTVFGMCHKQEHGLNVFKCATVCADLPNCPSKIVPKGWYDARVKQIETLQRMLKDEEALLNECADFIVNNQTDETEDCTDLVKRIRQKTLKP
jgi:hypothetical protein